MSVDVAWTAAMALLVYFMHAGFGFYEAGMCREKNTVDTLTHNLVILVLTIVVYWLVGFALMFGRGNGLLGWTGFAPSLFSSASGSFPALAKSSVPLVVSFAFAASYADTPATLIAGTGAERIKLVAVMLLTVWISGFVFPVAAHWTIGHGWLAARARPAYDTGAGSVQLCGGACAAAVAVVLGPRRGRFARGDRRAFGVSSMPMVFLGGFTLWLGFLAFNAGFGMRATPAVGLLVVNTVLAGSAGAATTFLASWAISRKAELRATIVGLLTANVAITSAAGVVAPWAAVSIGVAAGAATVGSIRLVARLGLDDPTEYLTMNVVGGLLGLVAVGLFASPAIVAAYDVQAPPGPGLVYGQAAQLWAQLVAAGSVFGFAFVAVALAAAALKSCGQLRVTAGGERAGADRAAHGERAGGAAREPQP